MSREMTFSGTQGQTESGRAVAQLVGKAIN